MTGVADHCTGVSRARRYLGVGTEPPYRGVIVRSVTGLHKLMSTGRGVLLLLLTLIGLVISQRASIPSAATKGGFFGPAQAASLSLMVRLKTHIDRCA